MKVSVSRRARFNSAHRLNNPNWSEERNSKVFGKCNLPNYHGHNYVLIATVRGEVDKDTGYVMDIKALNDLISVEVIEKFDHRNLNLDTDEFKDLNPTAENIAVVIWGLLRPEISDELELKVKLYETERNFVEFEG